MLGDPRASLARMGRRFIPPEDTIPTARPLGDTKLICSCGNVEHVDSQKLIKDGWTCKCGKRCVPARGDVAKREGMKALKRLRGRKP